MQSVQVSELNVIEKLKFAPPPTSKGLEISSVGKIHCKVQGTPTPQIQWTKVSGFFCCVDFEFEWKIHFLYSKKTVLKRDFFDIEKLNYTLTSIRHKKRAFHTKQFSFELFQCGIQDFKGGII